jgi:hypothetical protein
MEAANSSRWIQDNPFGENDHTHQKFPVLTCKDYLKFFELMLPHIYAELVDNGMLQAILITAHGPELRKKLS